MVVRLWQELKWRPSCCVIFCKVPLVFLCVWWCKQTLCFLRLSGCYGRRQHGLWEMETYPTKYGSGAGWWLVQPFFEKSQKKLYVLDPVKYGLFAQACSPVCNWAQEVLYDLTLTSLITGKHLGRQIYVRSWNRIFLLKLFCQSNDTFWQSDRMWDCDLQNQTSANILHISAAIPGKIDEIWANSHCKCSITTVGVI